MTLTNARSGRICIYRPPYRRQGGESMMLTNARSHSIFQKVSESWRPVVYLNH